MDVRCDQLLYDQESRRLTTCQRRATEFYRLSRDTGFVDAAARCDCHRPTESDLWRPAWSPGGGSRIDWKNIGREEYVVMKVHGS